MKLTTDEISSLIKEQVEKFEKRIDVEDVGRVLEVGDGVARVSGLDKCMAGELIEFPNNVFGMAQNLEEDHIGVVLLGDEHLIGQDDVAKRTGRDFKTTRKQR